MSNLPFQAGMNQRWQAVVVKESFQRVEASHQLVGGRRNVARVVQRAARGSDPVLAAPEFSRRCCFATHAPHESLVDLADQAQGQWQCVSGTYGNAWKRAQSIAGGHSRVVFSQIVSDEKKESATDALAYFESLGATVTRLRRSGLHPFRYMAGYIMRY